MSAPTDQDVPDTWISCMLGAVGGYADTAVFLLTGSFTGHITGNSVLATIHASHGEWNALMLNALAIGSFVISTYMAMTVRRRINSTVRSYLSLVLCLEAVLLLPIGLEAALHHEMGSIPVVVLACTALGFQNGSLTRLGGVSVHTTFITGMATATVNSVNKSVESEGWRLGLKRSMHERTTKVDLSLWACFLAGALAAALMARWEHSLLFGPLIALLLILALATHMVR